MCFADPMETSMGDGWMVTMSEVVVSQLAPV